MSQLLTDLERLLAYFQEGPHRWTKKADALDAYGHKVSAADPGADCHCLVGGTIKIGGSSDERALNMRTALRDALYDAREKYGLVDFNDDRRTTYAHVLSVIERAIEMQRERAA